MTLRTSRYRLGKYGIPLFLAGYLLVAGMHLVFGDRSTEIFPFFAWTLFPRTPEWRKTLSAVIVHSVDGEPVDGESAGGARYVIPRRNIGHLKVLHRAVRECRMRPDGCDAAVARLLHPIVTAVTRGDRVDFSVVIARIDLREVRKDVANLAAGRSEKTDHFRPVSIVGRWTTPGGRTPGE